MQGAVVRPFSAPSPGRRPPLRLRLALEAWASLFPATYQAGGWNGRLFTYIWRHSLGEQLAVLGVIVLSLPFYFLALNLPKLIVNGPIQGGGFEDGRRAPSSA